MTPGSSARPSGWPWALRLGTLWLVFAVPSAAPAIADGDPFVGTWSLDTAASKYANKEMPRSMLIVMQAVLGGIHYKSKTTYRNLRVATAEYTAEYDGHLAMVVGDAGILAPVTLRRIDRNTVEASYLRGFQKVASSRRVVSPEGSVMKVITLSKREDGSEVRNVGIYRRVLTRRDV